MFKMAKFLIIFSALIAIAVGNPSSNGAKATFIIGGDVAGPSQFPYIVSLRTSNKQHFCGGSIINDQWVLTAAHCLSTFKSPTEFHVVAGTHALQYGGTTYATETFIIHNDYTVITSVFVDNDIALIKIRSKFYFNNYIQPLQLCDTEPPVNSDVVVTGWGLVKTSDEALPNNLQYLFYKTANWADCVIANRPAVVSQNSLCAKATSLQGICNGDSGGPLVYRSNQIGIASWGKGCAVGTPDVYTNVCKYSAWIRRITSY